MLNRMLSLLLGFIMLNAVSVNVAAKTTQATQDTKQIEKVKEGVRKLGIGTEAKVEVKLVDGRKFKGFIKDIADDHFVVLDRKTGADITVGYDRVKEIKGQNGLTARKVAITAGKAALVWAAVAGTFTLLALIIVPKS